MTSSSTRMFIHWRNAEIAIKRLVAAIGEHVIPAWQQLRDLIGENYEALQRAKIYYTLPTWLPYRAQIAQRWPKRWLPSSASMIRWMKGESDGVDQR